MNSLEKYFNGIRRKVLENIARFVPDSKNYPHSIYRALHYSLSTGKRVRPALVYAVSGLCPARNKTVLYDLDILSTAIEMIHTYSLIHDDLPGMDNDDLRRGKLTCHKKFNEAIAILAGDALLTMAFELLTKLKTDRKIDIIKTIAAAIGPKGMIGGQVVDIESSGRKLSRPEMKRIVSYIHRTKTAALIQASVVTSGIICGLPGRKMKKVEVFGELLGISFQVIDDILDVEGTEKELGKTKSDVKNEKLTFPAAFGLVESKTEAFSLIEDAKASLDIFGRRAFRLKKIADFVFSRSH